MRDFNRIYFRWNYTTACCYKYKTKCAICPNQITCSIVENKIHGMHPIKYAMLKTLENIGLQGIERFVEVKEK